MNFLRTLTPEKVRNYLRVRKSFQKSRKEGKAFHQGYPVSLSIEPTTSCNLRCPECPSGLRSFTRPTGMLDKVLYKKAIDELKEHLLYLSLYFQGEPYLHPDFFDLVSYAQKAGVYTSTSTNAHYLDSARAEKTVRSGLDRIVISIDGTTQDTYEQYRVGGQLEKVIEGTKNLVRWKKELRSRSPFIIFQFLVVAPNEHQIEDVKRLAAELGVDHVGLKTAQIYDYVEGSPLMPKNERYSRYKQVEEGKYEVKAGWDNECWRMWQGAVLTWDGKVVPCCFDKDAQHQMGSLQNRPFHEIWQSIAYQSFRDQLLKDRSSIDMCKNCTEGGEVWA